MDNQVCEFLNIVEFRQAFETKVRFVARSLDYGLMEAIHDSLTLVSISLQLFSKRWTTKR